MTSAWSIADLTAQLRALGLHADDIVMIHASMRRVGPVEGGAAGVIEALCAAVGAGGTLLMVLCADEDEPFDLADVRDKVRVRRRYVRADTGELWIESLDDTDGIATWAHGDYFPQIFLDYRTSGAVRIGPVGRCEAELFDSAPFVEFAVAWMNARLGGA